MPDKPLQTDKAMLFDAPDLIRTPPGSPLGPIDRFLLLLLTLYGAVALPALALVPMRFLPAEDAVILFAYSRNLALHGAITFLAGGPHVEGATDFGWMLLIAAAIRCGISPFWFCAAVNVLALLALAALLLRLASTRITASRVLIIAGSAALFRPIFAAASGFGVLPNAALLTLTVLCVLERRPAAAALASLALCLFRPDGVVFAVPLLLCLLVQTTNRRRTLQILALLFILPGVLYFLWRWHYFGELLPLPFLVKATFHHRLLGLLIEGSLKASLVPLLFTAVVLAPLALLGRAARLWLLLPLVVLPTLFYWCMRLDQNVGSRFFYYLPVAASVLLAAHWPALKAHRRTVLRTAFAAWLLLLAAPLYREALTFRYMQFDTAKGIAEDLARLPGRGTILVSEAGFVPFYSGWPSWDAWGLNTPEFAHRFFQADDVRRLAPDLIVLHPDLNERCIVMPDWQANYTDRQWPLMTRNIIEGAASIDGPGTGYELWLTSYGSEFYRRRKDWQPGEGDRECWLVRRNSGLRASLEQILTAHNAVAPAGAVALELAHDTRLHRAVRGRTRGPQTANLSVQRYCDFGGR